MREYETRKCIWTAAASCDAELDRGDVICVAVFGPSKICLPGPIITGGTVGRKAEPHFIGYKRHIGQNEHRGGLPLYSILRGLMEETSVPLGPVQCTETADILFTAPQVMLTHSYGSGNTALPTSKSQAAATVNVPMFLFCRREAESDVCDVELSYYGTRRPL